MLLNLVAGVDALREHGVALERIIVIGGAGCLRPSSGSPTVVRVPVAVPAPGDMSGSGPRGAALRCSQARTSRPTGMSRSSPRPSRATPTRRIIAVQAGVHLHGLRRTCARKACRADESGRGTGRGTSDRRGGDGVARESRRHWGQGGRTCMPPRTHRWRPSSSAAGSAAGSRRPTSPPRHDLPAAGYTVVLVEQPWRVAGMRSTRAHPGTSTSGGVPIPGRNRRPRGLAGPMITGGRSAGARVCPRRRAPARKGSRARLSAAPSAEGPRGRGQLSWDAGQARHTRARDPGAGGIPWGESDDIAGSWAPRGRSIGGWRPASLTFPV